MKRKFQCKDNPMVFVSLDECEKCKTKEECLHYKYEIEFNKKQEEKENGN
ncbi:MAG: hypothetical protein KKF56_05330 [Nanoarchaeota archaeon]|nr:hypothetical protein [Nanoarchaeota archaeon]